MRESRNLNHRRPAVEALDGRLLLSGDIAGVSLVYGVMTIQAPNAAGHNTVSVDYNADHSAINVTVNGQQESFAASSVFDLAILGSAGGHDALANNTNLADIIYASGDDDTVTGGTDYNMIVLEGSGSSFDAAGVWSDVIDEGTGNTVSGMSNANSDYEVASSVPW